MAELLSHYDYDKQKEFKIKWTKLKKGWRLHFVPATYPGTGHPIWITEKTKEKCLIKLVDSLNEYAQNWHYTKRALTTLFDKSFF